MVANDNYLVVFLRNDGDDNDKLSLFAINGDSLEYLDTYDSAENVNVDLDVFPYSLYVDEANRFYFYDFTARKFHIFESQNEELEFLDTFEVQGAPNVFNSRVVIEKVELGNLTNYLIFMAGKDTTPDPDVVGVNMFLLDEADPSNSQYLDSFSVDVDAVGNEINFINGIDLEGNNLFVGYSQVGAANSEAGVSVLRIEDSNNADDIVYDQFDANGVITTFSDGNVIDGGNFLLRNLNSLDVLDDLIYLGSGNGGGAPESHGRISILTLNGDDIEYVTSRETVFNTYPAINGVVPIADDLIPIYASGNDSLYTYFYDSNNQEINVDSELKLDNELRFSSVSYSSDYPNVFHNNIFYFFNAFKTYTQFNIVNNRLVFSNIFDVPYKPYDTDQINESYCYFGDYVWGYNQLEQFDAELALYNFDDQGRLQLLDKLVVGDGVDEPQVLRMADSINCLNNRFYFAGFDINTIHPYLAQYKIENNEIVYEGGIDLNNDLADNQLNFLGKYGDYYYLLSDGPDADDSSISLLKGNNLGQFEFLSKFESDPVNLPLDLFISLDVNDNGIWVQNRTGVIDNHLLLFERQGSQILLVDKFLNEEEDVIFDSSDGNFYSFEGWGNRLVMPYENDFGSGINVFERVGDEIKVLNFVDAELENITSAVINGDYLYVFMVKKMRTYKLTDLNVQDGNNVGGGLLGGGQRCIGNTCVDVVISEDSDSDEGQDEDSDDEISTPNDSTDRQNRLPFPDVEESDWFYEYVLNLYLDNLVQGYPDGTYKPANDINRAEFTKIVALATDDFNGTVQIENVFNDISVSDWFYVYIQKLYPDVLEGYGDYFGPSKSITRAEALKILIEVFGEDFDSEMDYENDFTDVGESDWFEDYVGFASQTGYVEGYVDGSFKPDAPINRAEAAKLLDLFME